MRFLKSYNYTPTSPDVNTRLAVLICLFPWSTQTNIRSAPSLLCLYCAYTTLIRIITTNRNAGAGCTPAFLFVSQSFFNSSRKSGSVSKIVEQMTAELVPS